MSPWGIQVSIIEPGLFKTAMANEERNLQAVQELWDGLSPQVKEEYGDGAVEKSKYGQRSITDKSPLQLNAAHQFIPLTNRVRGPYCKLRTEVFPVDLWPNREARGP